MSQALLQAERLTVTRGERRLFHDLALHLEAGQCWGILGANGSGKTSLLHSLAGLNTADEGSVHLLGEPITALSRRRIAQHLGLLLQDSIDPFPSTVLDTALSGRHPHLHPWSLESPNDLALAREALKEVGLQDLEDRLTHTLSGGERRRLAIATLLTQAPDIFLLDEPTNHLDLNHQMQLLTHFRQCCQPSRGVIMVLHDINLAARFCDRLLYLYPDGHWESGESAVMLEEGRLQRLYGHPLLRLEGPTGDLFVPA